MGRISETMKKTLAGVLAAVLVLTSSATDAFANEVVLDDYVALDAIEEDVAVVEEDAAIEDVELVEEVEASEVIEDAAVEAVNEEAVVEEDVDVLGETTNCTITFKTQKGDFYFDRLYAYESDDKLWDYKVVPDTGTVVDSPTHIWGEEFAFEVSKGISIELNLDNISGLIYYSGSYTGKGYDITGAYTENDGIYSFDEVSQNIVITRTFENQNWSGEPEEKVWYRGFADSLVYVPDGVVQKDIEVYYGDELLTEGRDYTISYKNNKKVTTSKNPAKMTIKGKGGYSFKETKEFQITPFDFSKYSETVSINKTKAKKYDPYAGNGFKLGKDYKLSVVGDAKQQDKKKAVKLDKDSIVSVNFIGNYKGSIEYTVKLTDWADYSKAKVSLTKKTFPWSEKGIDLVSNNNVKVSKVVSDNKVVLLFEDDDAKANMSNVGKHTVYAVVGSEADLADINNYEVIDYTKFKNDNYKEVKLSYTVKGTKIKAKDINWKKATFDNLVFNGTNQFAVLNSVSFNNPAIQCSTILVKPNGDKKFEKAFGLYSAGTYKVTYEGDASKGYTGKVTKQFKIKPYNINGDAITAKTESVSMNYSPKGNKMGVIVTASEKLNYNSPNYILSYKNNSKVTNNASVIIKGIRNYTGKKTLTYAINPGNLSDATAKVASATEKNYKKAQKLLFDDGTQIKSSNYKVSYWTVSGDGIGTEIKRKNDIVSLNEIFVKFDGKKNYTGTKLEKMKIYKEAKNLSSLKFKTVELTYNGKVQSVSMGQIALRNSIDKELKDIMDIPNKTVGTNVGTYKLEVVAKENSGYVGVATVTVKIVKNKDIEEKKTLNNGPKSLLDMLLDFFN